MAQIDNIFPATPMQIMHLFKSEVGKANGRSAWKIYWTDDGDMIFGCWPQGDTFINILDAQHDITDQPVNEDLID